MDETLRVTYVLYSHYAFNEVDDFRDHTIRGKPIEELSGVQHLTQHFRGLKELLNTPGHEGMVVLFYAPGFKEFLDGVALGKSGNWLITNHPELKFANEFATCVRDKLSQEGLAHRVPVHNFLGLGVHTGAGKQRLGWQIR